MDWTSLCMYRSLIMSLIKSFTGGDFGNKKKLKPASGPDVFANRQEDWTDYPCRWQAIAFFFFFYTHLYELNWKISSWEADKIKLCTRVKTNLMLKMPTLFLIQFLQKKASHCVSPLMLDFFKRSSFDSSRSQWDPVFIHVFDRKLRWRNPPGLFTVTSPDHCAQLNCTQRVKCHLT